MATTEEGKVKKEVKKLLKSYEPSLWYVMCVPGGFGVGGIPDFMGLYKGRFFGIETKKPGRRGEVNAGLSGLQVLVRKQILAAGGKYFVVDDAGSQADVERWLQTT